MREITTAEQLLRAPGDEIDVGPWFELTQDLVDRFADISGDHQWIHVDVDRAGGSAFGGTIAHGILLLALVPRLRTYRISMPSRHALNYGLDRLRFPAPVPVGSLVRLRTSVLKVDAIASDQLQVYLRHTLEIQGSVKPGMIAEPITRYYLEGPLSFPM